MCFACVFCFFKQKTAYEMRISDWSSDVCSSDLIDDVMDEMDEAVDLALLYGVTVLPPEAASQVELLQRCAELTTNAMPRLRSMQDLNEYWIEINRLENQGDKSHRRLLASLFNGQYEPLEVIRPKAIVESIAGAIDAFETEATIVE